MRTPLLPIAVATLVLAAATGCTATVPLKPAAAATDPQCAAVTARLPGSVAGLESRETNAQATGAWGDPARVLLYCGVAVPDPTSTLACITVEGIDWLRDPANDPKFAFTSYGRDPAVTVIVDSEKVGGGPVLEDLAPAVGIIPAERHCVTPEQVIENGEPTK